MEVMKGAEEIEYEGLPPNAGLGVSSGLLYCAMSAHSVCGM